MNTDKSLKGFMTLNDPPVDHLITTGRLDWEHTRYMMGQALKNCNEEGESYFKQYGFNGIPGFSWCKRTIEQKLINAGFTEEFIKKEIGFKQLIYTINFEQFGNYPKHPPRGFPSGTYIVSDDKEQMRIREDIESALLALDSMRKLEELVVKDGVVNNEVLKAYIHSFQLAINLVRSGLLPKFAREGKIQSINNKAKGKERWSGSAEERADRNQEIFKHFKKAFAKGNITLHGFTVKYAKKYDCKPTQMKKIIKSFLDT